VPKKTKTAIKEVEQDAVAASAAGIPVEKSSRRPSAKAKKPAVKKATKRAAANPIYASKSVRRAEPTEEEIRIRAYFISERRHRLALPGDATGDWAEARRQLLAEVGTR
jgi:hypothetical protein